jgi:hypothetical protein
MVKLPLEALDEEVIDAWLDSLPHSEVHGYLKQMLSGQGIDAERALRRRFDLWQRQNRQAMPQKSGRTIGELEQLTAQAQEERLAGGPP